jgi:hypothetical protein
MVRCFSLTSPLRLCARAALPHTAVRLTRVTGRSSVSRPALRTAHTNSVLTQTGCAACHVAAAGVRSSYIFFSLTTSHTCNASPVAWLVLIRLRCVWPGTSCVTTTILCRLCSPISSVSRSSLSPNQCQVCHRSSSSFSQTPEAVNMLRVL